MPSENLSDGIFYQSSHIFYQGCKIYPKQQKPPCRHSRKSGNLETQHGKNLSEATTIFSSSFPRRRESRFQCLKNLSETWNLKKPFYPISSCTDKPRFPPAREYEVWLLILVFCPCGNGRFWVSVSVFYFARMAKFQIAGIVKYFYFLPAVFISAP
ncbi:hypothetical protein [Neisseria meningitidis]|uniref:hypothetical protein n=1 Tax=Neisseria meningitidis TaxID=487 RepID=UPI00163FE733|nr:hypothetical protein [Neisseria meningitidis]